MQSVFIWFLALALVAPRLVYGQSLTQDPGVAEALNLLEIWLDAERDYEQIPGISVGVVYDQDLIWSKGFGYAHLDRMAPATPSTIYSICSISKLFTSIGVMQLRDQGRLRLDDPVNKHLAWFTIEQAYPQGPAITIEGLLTHSAGLPRESDHPYWTGPEFAFPTHDEIVAGLSKQETLYPARTYYQYSNLGLTLAGEIVAAVSGQPYATYVRANILNPLGLDDTSPEIPTVHKGDRLATGYSALTREGERLPMPFLQVRGIAPAAGFASTVEDLAKFASWQFRLLTHGGKEVLHANTLREMQRVHWLDPDWETTRGLGFSVWRHNDKTFVGHGGSCPGYRTQLALQTNEQIGLIFMTNALGVSPGSYTSRMYDMVAPAILGAVESSQTAKRPVPAFRKYTGLYEASFGGEAAVVDWGGSLAMLYLPTDDPVDGLMKLQHTGEHTFRRIRDDGELGEAITFEVGPDGQVQRVWRNNNFMPKVR